MMKRVALLLAALSWSTSAAAQTAQASQTSQALQPSMGIDHLRYTNTVYAQMNFRTLAEDIRVRYRPSLYRSEKPLFAMNFVGLMAGATVAPGLFRPTIGVEVQPLSVFSFGASFEPTYFYNVLGLGQSYPSPTSDFRSGPVKQPKDGPRGSYSFYAPQVTLYATAQAAAGRFVFRNAFKATKLLGVDVNEGDRVVYEPSIDVPVYRNGWWAQNDTDIGFRQDGLVLGLRHTLVVAWYPSGSRPATEVADNPNTPAGRVGPILAYTLFANRGGLVDAATLLGVVQWHYVNRYRTGTETSAALPLVGAGFTLAGDLL